MPAGTQTLERGLRILDAVADGAADLAAIGRRLGLSRSTTQRLTAALVAQGLLRLEQGGYRLGPKLIQLGYAARVQVQLVALARPPLERLAAATGDSVHLGQADGDAVLYLDKIDGQRGLELRSRIGARMQLARTGIGKALMLDMDEAGWRRLYDAALAGQAEGGQPLPWDAFVAAMRRYRDTGIAFDLAENEFGVRCVAAPVRDAAGRIAAAISVAAAAPWMELARMRDIAPAVAACAREISQGLGAR